MTACAPETLKGLIDSTPNVAVLISLADRYAQRVLPEKGVDSDLAYECPRTQLMVRTAVKGTTIGTHFHTVCDEYVIVVGGRGEIPVNLGKDVLEAPKAPQPSQASLLGTDGDAATPGRQEAGDRTPASIGAGR